MAGLRVVRGPDWSHRDADGGEGHLGTVVDLNNSNGTANVIWDTGKAQQCRVGNGGKFDLRVFDNASVGVIFKDDKCSECKSQHFFGMKWRCMECPDINICSICYFRDKHDTTHSFIRFSMPYTDTKGVEVPKRSSSSAISSLGMYPGAKVVRGKDWQYGNQDDGNGNTGTVKDIRSFGTDLSHRNAVAVQWSSGKYFKYRVGHRGKVDLKCVEEAKGFYYYRDHLPQLDPELLEQHNRNKTTLDIEVGDKVCIKIDVEDLKTLQRSHGGYNAKMESIVGKVGSVKGFTPAGDVVITVDGDKWVLNPRALSKVQTVSIGDIVMIKNDQRTVEALQIGHGGWHTDMAKVLGKVGKIARFTSKKDVVVAFGKKYWVFNKACLIPAPGATVDRMESTGEVPLEGASILDELSLLVAHLLVADAKTRQSSQSFLREAASGNAKNVQKLCKETPALCNTVIKGTTALIAASFEGHEEVVKVLLQSGAKTDLQDRNGNTALLASVAAEKAATTKLLVDKGADVNIGNKDKRTPIHVVARSGVKSTAQLLLQRKCNVNAQEVYNKDRALDITIDGYQVLRSSVHDTAVRSIDLDLDSEGYTPLHDAISKSNDEMIELLIQYPNADFRLSNNRGFNCLQYSALKGSKIAAQRILMKCREMTNDSRKDGFTALHIAAFNNRVDIASILLEVGKADVDKKNRDGNTSLHLACKEAYYDMAKLLIEHGADINICDSEGNTCLHWALGGKRFSPRVGFIFVKNMEDKAERVRVACLLIDKRCNFDVKNKSNKKPLDLASDDLIKQAVLEYKNKRDKQSQSDTTTTAPEEPFIQKMVVPCYICFKQTGSVTILPCKHRVLCQLCCYRIDECPVCLKNIELRVDKDGNEVLRLGDLCPVQ